MTCIYVFMGHEVLREEVDEHPGMHSISKTWDYPSKLPKGVMAPMIRPTHTENFYWDHIDRLGNHVFRADPKTNLKD